MQLALYIYILALYIVGLKSQDFMHYVLTMHRRVYLHYVCVYIYDTTQYMSYQVLIKGKGCTYTLTLTHVWMQFIIYFVFPLLFTCTVLPFLICCRLCTQANLWKSTKMFVRYKPYIVDLMHLLGIFIIMLGIALIQRIYIICSTDLIAAPFLHQN